MNTDSIPDAQRLLATLSEPVRRGEVTPLDAIHTLLKERGTVPQTEMHLIAISDAILELIRTTDYL